MRPAIAKGHTPLVYPITPLHVFLRDIVISAMIATQRCLQI